MQLLIKLLDKKLKYINHEIVEYTIIIQVKLERKSLQCPNCNKTSNKVHLRYKRTFQDLLMLV